MSSKSSHAEQGRTTKRRKVEHACIYCRRSHMTCDLARPCNRCKKRNIGHLCHDEPRESIRQTNKAINDASHPETRLPRESEHSLLAFASQAESSPPPTFGVESAVESQHVPGSAGPTALEQLTVSGTLGLGGQGHYHDMHNLHPSYMFNAPEVTSEYSLLNDFLSHSLLEETSFAPGNKSDIDDAAVNGHPKVAGAAPDHDSAIDPQSRLRLKKARRPSSAGFNEKAQATYYLTAADPASTDAPDTRINELLQAKYDAGMLRPFNYVKGYARLYRYMEQHLHLKSRQRIIRQLERFRPNFRERMHRLTDVELVLVEMWFERSLMGYDRVFASMAIPACCWRRTGEIFRGNKAMAELIQVPIERLREGHVAIHEIIVEEDLVKYWEKFGAIAFDNSQKAMLTSCSLQYPGESRPGETIRCCFSFTIRRDEHNM